jgi:uncharacterized protein (DUF362 family)
MNEENMTHSSNSTRNISRRDFLTAAVIGSTGLLVGCQSQPAATPTSLPAMIAPTPIASTSTKPVVSIVKIKDGKIGAAVEEAIELLGGIEAVTTGKDRIMLKPNLVSNDPRSTTKSEVVRTLATLMKQAGKTVSIGEGSAAASGFNVKGSTVYRLKTAAKLNDMQQFVFDSLGYTALAQALDIPLINLHSGDMVEVDVPGGLAYQKLTLHRALTEIDLLCSVPMMKTHTLATVTLGMKNLIGLYPGTIYHTVRAGVHDHAADAGSPGIAYEILDMVRANKLGLVVIDGSTAMEGNGPDNGILVPMNVIIAGTNPLATDMVATSTMGFAPEDVPTFVQANKIGMQPARLDDIEIRGATIADVRQSFLRPILTAWNDIRDSWGVQEMP